MKNGIVSAGVVLAMAAVAYGCGGGDTTGSTGTGSGGESSTTATSSVTASSSSSSSSAASTSASTSTGSGSSTGAGGSVPIVCTPTDGVVLALDTINFGDVGSDVSASQMLGFNVDGLVSTAASTDLCQPVMGGSKNSVYPDGTAGIDNSFGKHVLPLLLMLAPGFSESTTNSVANGDFTMLLDFVGLTAAADQPALTTRLYGGTPLGSPPSFDGKDCWPVAPELLSDPTDIKSSTVVFDKSAVAGNKWVSGTANTITLTIPTGPASITLTIHKAQVSLTLAADHQSATGGLIGGVLDTDEFIKEIKKAIYAINPLYCGLTGQVEPQMRQASDILVDGTQSAAKTCNGISIGFGFTMKQMQLGGVGPKTAPATMTCTP